MIKGHEASTGAGERGAFRPSSSSSGTTWARTLAKSAYWYGDSLRRFVRNEKPQEFKLPLNDRLRWNARSFHEYSVGIYDLTDDTWREYPPDFGGHQPIRLNRGAPAAARFIRESGIWLGPFGPRGEKGREPAIASLALLAGNPQNHFPEN